MHQQSQFDTLECPEGMLDNDFAITLLHEYAHAMLRFGVTDKNERSKPGSSRTPAAGIATLIQVVQRSILSRGEGDDTEMIQDRLSLPAKWE
ncbi:hypothetical protein QRT08_17800 [Halalkalicoccus sp. NIPERK01]|nr:hypothetical protein [Halalkalicoccus sp. NIPERK01]MDL5363821.1 hypothetical protein [Halalkalicoccus sp. NIPERK01]